MDPFAGVNAGHGQGPDFTRRASPRTTVDAKPFDPPSTPGNAPLTQDIQHVEAKAKYCRRAKADIPAIAQAALVAWHSSLRTAPKNCAGWRHRAQRAEGSIGQGYTLYSRGEIFKLTCF